MRKHLNFTPTLKFAKQVAADHGITTTTTTTRWYSAAASACPAKSAHGSTSSNTTIPQGCPAHNHQTEPSVKKSFDSIPGPKGYPLLGNLEFFTESTANAFMARLVKEYGEVVKFNVLGSRHVLISNPYLVKEIAQQDEGRIFVKSLRQVKLDENMLMTPVEAKFNENWQDIRSLFNIAMRPDLSETISLPQLTELNSGFIKALITHLKEQENIQSTLDQVKDEQFKQELSNSKAYKIERTAELISNYTFNSVSKVFLGVNLYNSTVELPFDRNQFVIDAVRILDVGLRNDFQIPFFQYLRRKQYMYFKNLYLSLIEKSSECIKLFAENHSGKPRLKELVEEKSKEFEKSEELTTATLSSFLMAGVDITARTLTIAMYRLAHESKYQEKLYQEVTSVLGEPTADEFMTGNLNVSSEQYKKLKLLKHFLIESMRLTHVGDVGSVRVLSKDLTIGGYELPKDTFVYFFESPNSSEKYMPQPLEFVPERHEKNHELQPVNNFVQNPFGLGARKCPGSRIASTEITFALINIIRHFRLVHENPNVFPERATDQPLGYINTNNTDLYFFPRAHMKSAMKHQ